MRATAAQGQTDKPVQHLSISLPPGEHLSREQWEGVVDTTLRDLGLSGHQALIVAHRDKAHEHIHIMANRVHPETLLAWDRWGRLRAVALQAPEGDELLPGLGRHQQMASWHLVAPAGCVRSRNSRISRACRGSIP